MSGCKKTSWFLVPLRERQFDFYGGGGGGGKITLVLEILFVAHRSLAFYFLRGTVLDFFQPGTCV